MYCVLRIILVMCELCMYYCTRYVCRVCKCSPLRVCYVGISICLGVRYARIVIVCVCLVCFAYILCVLCVYYHIMYVFIHVCRMCVLPE